MAASSVKCELSTPSILKLCPIGTSQAAKFGRGFLDLHNPTDFVNMGRTLKVLNAIRYYEIGIPLTYSQYVFPPFSFGLYLVMNGIAGIITRRPRILSPV